jgi:hypothetical protein
MIYAALEPRPILVLKNVTDEGLAGTKIPIENLDDAKLIFQRLAQFHAASYYLAEDVRFKNNLKI